MLRTSFDETDCPFARAAGEIGDPWLMLVLWATLNGVTRFDDLQRKLGVARNILSSRLKLLCERGLLERRPLHDGARRCEYIPTARAEPLYEPFAMIRAWGQLHTVAPVPAEA